jgi:hypothetical protein
MTKKIGGNERSDEGERPPSKVRLPGFITDEDIGLGDIVTRMTHAAGIWTCGGCAQRAAVLNRWLVFSGKRGR